jgi:hypothetical protein
MKLLKQWTNWLYNNIERWLFYGLILVAGIIGTWFTYNYAVAFSDYFIVLLFVTIFFAVFDWFDNYILKTIDTINEIKKGNTAVSQFLVAIALLVLAAAITVS